MSKHARSTAEEKYAALMEKDRGIMNDLERARTERQKRSAELRALREKQEEEAAKAAPKPAKAATRKKAPRRSASSY
jgi:hypothetical protein